MPANRTRPVRTITLTLAFAGILLLPQAGLAWLDPAEPDVLVVRSSQDDQFSFSSPDTQTRWSLGAGQATTSLIKGWQDVTVLGFDLAGQRGRIVEQAELHLCQANADPVLALVVATINTPWQEGRTSGGTAGIGDPCWRWRSRPANPGNPASGSEWTFRYSDFSTASFGHFGSLVSYAYRSDLALQEYVKDGRTWVWMRLDPAVVQALILDQYGLMVTDARNNTYVTASPRVYTSEAGPDVQPRLHIRFAETTDTVPPEGVTQLTATAGPEDGEVVLSWAAPVDPQAQKAFGYHVRYRAGAGEAIDVQRWRIPRPRTPGGAERMLLEDLQPGTAYTFSVQAYDAAGNGGPVSTTTFTLPAARPVATLADSDLVVPSAGGVAVREVPGVLRWWAGSEMAKFNPITGNRIEDGYTGTGADDYKKANVVWDAASNTIRLTACRNEVVGAQLVIERTGQRLDNVRLAASDLVGPAGATIGATPHIEFFQLYRIRSGSDYYSDPAVPLDALPNHAFTIPAATANTPRMNQSVWIDLYVPKTSPAGVYTGTIAITADQLAAPVTVNLRVRVSRLTIPDEPTFLVDLNGYSHPWEAYPDPHLARLRYFQAAHKHRAMVNLLPYGWSATVRPDRRPELSGEGPTLHASDWSVFDERYGPLFDGSAFRPDTPGSPYVGPGEGVPVTHMYTPFFESWPIHIADPVYGFDAPPMAGEPGAYGLGGAYWDGLFDTDRLRLFGLMPDIYASWPAGYRQGVRNVVADWFRHAQQKGWTRTRFQIYLNHKYYYEGCAIMWELEEYEAADDPRAVGFFHQLYRDGQAMAAAPEVKWHFRIDISDRISQSYGQLANRINYYMVNHRSASWHWRQIEYRNWYLDADKPEEWNWYNLGAGIAGAGTGHMKLFLQKWCQGYTGGLPYWDNYQTSWGSINDLSLVYSTADTSLEAMHAPAMSMRVKTMRQAQQVVELLNLWAQVPGMNRSRVRDAIGAAYGDGTWDYAFEDCSEVDLYRLRADLIAQLEPLLRMPGDVDGDGMVDLRDLLRVVNAFGTMRGHERFDAAADLAGDTWVDVLDVVEVVNHFGDGVE